jgi:hypothetical protein
LPAERNRIDLLGHRLAFPNLERPDDRAARVECLTLMNDDQIKGLGGAMFQLGNITLVATLAGLITDPGQWPRTYVILVAGFFGLAAWIFLCGFAMYLLSLIGQQQGGRR